MAEQEQKTSTDTLDAAQKAPPPPSISGTLAAPGGDDEIIDFDPDIVDRVLAQEDPQFAAELKEIQNSEFKVNVAIEAVDIEAFLKEGENPTGKLGQPKKLSFKERFQVGYQFGHAKISLAIDDFQNLCLRGAKSSLRLLSSSAKFIFKYSLGALGRFFSMLVHLPPRTKLLSFSVLLLLGASGFSIYMSLKGHFLPQMGREYLVNLGEYADETFEYKDSDSKESFDSEIRHPEHMYEVEKIIVNLKDPGNGERLPMGLFEFYIEMNSQEATVEMGDRKTEAKHIIERVIEQLSYDELVSPQGKAKLKFIVRKQLNDFLTKSHHVRQVYLKTFVLKP